MMARVLALRLLVLAACSSQGSAPPGRDAQADGSGGPNLPDAALDARSSPDSDLQPEEDAMSGSPDAASETDAGGATLPARTFVYAGGYGNEQSFRVFEIDRGSLALREVRRDVDAGPSPSYICPSRDGRYLYVANEDDGAPGVTVLEIDPTTGVPQKIDHEAAISSSFVFTSLDPAGNYLLAASYNGANVAVFSVRREGGLEARVDVETFAAGAQSHAVRVHPSGKWAFVPNKGLDAVAQFHFDAGTGKLTPNEPASYASYAGPRHIAFSPDGAFAFLMAEVANELSALAVQSDGTLRELDHKPRLPTSYAGTDTGAHVLAHPQGKYVYGSNRGSDTIVVFAYDAQGKLSLVEHEPTRGRTPRNFDIDPHGQFLIVANQDGDQGGSLSVFAIAADGKLSARGSVVPMPSVSSVAIVGL